MEGSITSGLASGVPGDVKGLEYLHKKYGVRDFDFSGRIVLIVLQKLPWRAVVNPAVHVARYGFPGIHLRDFVRKC